MFQLLRRSVVEKLPQSVKNQLTAQFNVRHSQIDQVLCVSKKGIYAGRPVKHLLVFDPPADFNPGNHQLKYEDVKSLSGATLFEVRVEQDGSMYFTDMRPGQNKHPVRGAQESNA